MDFFKSLESNIKGTLGEGIAGAILYHLCINGYSGYPFHNIYLPKENGEYSEIDLAFVTKKGVFVFECKNYSGWIFGSEENRYWTASLPNGQKNQFYNPVKQNGTHIRELKKHIGNDIPCFSIVVFSDRCELKKITVNENQVKVVKVKTLFDIMSRLWPNIPDVLSDEKVNEIAEIIKCFTHASSEIKKSHIETIKSKQQTYTKTQTQKTTGKETPRANMDIMDIISSTIRRF